MRAAVILLLVSAAVLADELRLRNGDVLHGKIVERTDDYVVIEHPDLGRVTIPADKLAPTTPAEQIEQEEKVEEEKQKPKWKYNINFGGAYSNDDEGQKTDLNFGFGVQRALETSITRLTGRYLFSYKNQETDKDNATINLSQRWPKPDRRWFWWTIGRFDYDAFRDWEQRLTLHGGWGYEILGKEDKTEVELNGLVGLGGRKEWGSLGNPLRSELFLGAEIVWKPKSKHSIGLSSYYYPTVGAPETQQRVITSFAWRYLVDAKSRLSLFTHLDWEYNTDPDPGFPLNNIRWTWGVQWDF